MIMTQVDSRFQRLRAPLPIETNMTLMIIVVVDVRYHIIRMYKYKV